MRWPFAKNTTPDSEGVSLKPSSSDTGPLLEINLLAPPPPTPTWPRIAQSDIWRELRAHYEERLRVTVRRLVVETDEKAIRLYQIRVMVLTEIINEPDIEVAKLQALMDNRFGAGEAFEDLQEERAGQNAGR